MHSTHDYIARQSQAPDVRLCKEQKEGLVTDRHVECSFMMSLIYVADKSLLQYSCLVKRGVTQVPNAVGFE